MIDTPLKCAKHPKVDTHLRCGKCDAPICPKCTVFTPVGARCRECSSMKTPLFKPSLLQVSFAAIVAIFTGVVAGWLLGLLNFGFFALFLAVPYGGVAGDLILRAGGRKRGRMLEIVAGVMFAVGAVGGRVVIGLLIMQVDPGLGKPYLRLLTEAFTPFPIAPIALGIALATIVSRIKYL